MYNSCIRLENVVTLKEGVASGQIVKVSTLSFLGDVDRQSGRIISQDVGNYGRVIKDAILITKRFRGSTVGVYVLYSMCKRGLAPKAILMCRPDPVVISGIILCDILGVSNIPENVYEKVPDGVNAILKCDKNAIELCFT
ncbi:MAG: DUF126 domain-containing protein [Ignisphaera sp.]|nr:DUF126 domain-containing protein [Ignisphaera sp.]MCC6056572.1 DUF126 domain-containing protein [Desulfurococcaceae archaeon]